MALSTEDAAWLVELKAARRKLILGDKRVSISSAGRSASYAPADLKTIEAEIERLESQLPGHERSMRRRGALRFDY